MQPEPHRWTVRVSAASAKSTVYARAHRFAIGLPLSFDRDYPETTALEHVLGAVGADLACGLERLARLRRLEVDNVEVVVHGELQNPLVHLGVVGETGSPEIRKLTVKAYLGSFEPEDALAGLWQDVLARSPLIATFRKSVELEIGMQIVI
jgi:hypothetical protein